jgi:alkaline phosphatase D
MKTLRLLGWIMAATLAVAACSRADKPSPYGKRIEAVAPLFEAAHFPFYHGVASGDPLTDRVIIWTRISPEDSLPFVEVAWEIADSKDFTTLIHSGVFTTTPDRDYTVKVDVERLQPGTPYYYRFHALGHTSLVGRTKTAPEGPTESLQFAVVSCANYEWGYFNAYARLGDRDLLDAVLHLGDYIYEYGIGGYGDTTIGRKHIPPHEIVKLDDYRVRYSQYRLDPGLRWAHQQQPFITVWDDHEIANDAYTEGAQNHQPEEGDYHKRKEAAKKAYYEWMPVREGDAHYRAFSFGNLAHLFMLDARLEGRTEPAEHLEDPRLQSPTHSMLGPEQLTWLKEGLAGSQAQWKIVGNQVIFSYLNQSFAFPNKPFNMDAWDGYPAERNEIARHIRSERLTDILILTGDTHASWAFEVALSPEAYRTGEPLAVEFGTPSISSSNYDEYTTADTARMVERAYIHPQVNPHLKFTNLRDHGYLLLTLSPQRAKAEWYYVDTVRKPSNLEQKGATYAVEKGTHRLEEIVE